MTKPWLSSYVKYIINMEKSNIGSISKAGRSTNWVVVLTLICLFIISCSVPLMRPEPQTGVYHLVKPGETLWGIAQAYGVKAEELAELNNINDPARLEANSVLFIPRARVAMEDVISAHKGQEIPARAPSGEILTVHPKIISKGKVPPAVTPREERRIGPGDKTDAKVKPDPRFPSEEYGLPIDKNRFIWPVNGEIIARFGKQPGGMFYNGIRIAAKEGTNVLAAAAGTVIFSAPLKDFGETIILRHEDNFATVYTNLGRRIVRMGDQARKGDQIALLDNPEHKGKAALHFEIRYKSKPYNPLLFLP